MKLGFVYAGQGSQKVGMGKDLYDNFSIFKDTFDKVDVDNSLKKLCFEGTLEEISETENTQPCMVAFAVSMTALLSSYGITPVMAAGLSLGEYSALCAADVFDDITAVELAKFRGMVMANAVSDIDCSMAAVKNLDRELLLKACNEASPLGVVEITNYNCPGQLVIGGEEAAVDKACELALEYGAKRCAKLQVSGPFHTSLMVPAGDALADKFKIVQFNKMKFPVIFNATAKSLQQDETVAELLVKQVQHSVYFEDSIRFMAESGIDTIIEIGPGKTLTSFIKKTVKGIKVLNVEDCESLAVTLDSLKEDE